MGDRQIDVHRRHEADVAGQEAEYNRALGERVREARLAQNMTQEQLASRLGVARTSVANLERGVQAPTAYRLARLAQVFSLEPQDLLPRLNDLISPSKHELDPLIYQAVVRTIKAAKKKQAKVVR
ncbi:helix-turn-helix transcriptional regulator [Nocardioides sp. SOB77]|uniref:Helix-turn-helix transcriptional regulator n=1 Tax=Nocardioides oceani TaxID=3058369 RepID=A0ABT8FMC3_9ACTN|nr:helix-turn-helix transcriptional regulator [Nocardioides oceani]MDN4175620.1 helix-turn-helix transcriptional regulator [Nocardioides oceani]